MPTLPEPYPFALPAIFVACDGSEPVRHPNGAANGILLRDLDLVSLERAVDVGGPPVAVDLDSIEGLNADAAAVRYLVRRLHVDVVMTRRPAVAARVADAGALALLRIFAFDSTGLERSLESNPRRPGVGTAISPGPVLGHLSPEGRSRLPRPLVAYGLIGTPERAIALLELADSVVLRPECAALVAAAGYGRRAIATGRPGDPAT
jgi:glycerol-3-phosphate responsive antiterminator